jgi:peptide/nickel transport system ATP-binding protein
MSNGSSQRSNGDLLLEVKDLVVSFRTDEGIIRAVDGVDLLIKRGRTLGIVGESGSGKSVSTQAIMQLLPKNGVIDAKSSIRLYRDNGEMVDITSLKPTGREIRRVRGGDISIIFQEPMSSFSPVYTVGNHIMEAIQAHRDVTKKEAREIAIDMMDRVGIANPAVRVDQYPFELSGGMRQRAMIAVALSSQPSLLIADEPTTALDVTIQAQILELMKQLQEEFQMTIVFITHDLGVIAQIADEISVMYLGRIMEHGTATDVIKDPKHPYTRRLLQAIPRLDQLGVRLRAVGGDIPSPLERPLGCPFHTRCPKVIAGRCDRQVPETTWLTETHAVTCFLYPQPQEERLP